MSVHTKPLWDNTLDATFSPSLRRRAVNRPAAAAPSSRVGQCRTSCGWMLNSSSSLSRRTTRRRGLSPSNAACRPSVVSSGRPFSWTMTSPDRMPLLETDEGTAES